MPLATRGTAASVSHLANNRKSIHADRDLAGRTVTKAGPAHVRFMPSRTCCSLESCPLCRWLLPFAKSFIPLENIGSLRVIRFTLDSHSQSYNPQVKRFQHGFVGSRQACQNETANGGHDLPDATRLRSEGLRTPR